MFPILLLILAIGQISCGSRIIGGQYAQSGQFPYQISLQLNQRHHCGGSLISDMVVITAAHCVMGQSPTKMRVVAGTADLLAGDGKAFEIADIVRHSQYNPETQDYDIALIKLKSAVPLGGNIQTIELASSESNYPADTLATISGFGAVNMQLQLPNKLKFAQVQLWSRDFCNPKNIPGITNRMVCAGHPSGQVSACQGDSGGPLTVDGKLFGLVSWGFGCGAKMPAIYTYVGALRSWITENSGV
ncbi:trypsin-1-like [Teleopsis dalmanni]|uniref:trypsin-1 n=1 Tax=Teleopsis dalmanni TaxID=139649 RepID=UPI0018CCAA48|nr:trypsin-1 [Teleopsis dalmanni]XP_037956088.1 trypsin-1-like [Teleopsis dalmanni]